MTEEREATKRLNLPDYAAKNHGYAVEWSLTERRRTARVRVRIWDGKRLDSRAASITCSAVACCYPRSYPPASQVTRQHLLRGSKRRAECAAPFLCSRATGRVVAQCVTSLSNQATEC